MRSTNAVLHSLPASVLSRDEPAGCNSALAGAGSPNTAPTRLETICHVLKGLLESHDHISQQASKLNQVSLDSSVLVDWSRECTEALNSNEATAYEELQDSRVTTRQRICVRQEAQDAMNLKMSFSVIGGGEDSKWTYSLWQQGRQL